MSHSQFNASDLFVKALENEGVEVIYGIPGEENLDLLESIRKSNIKLILTRHEQAAGFMAATYGRLTGKVGVAISTLGPGATNFTTPAAYATLGGFPVLFITGQKPIKKSKQGKFQVIDVVGMMKPITKYAKVIVSANNVTSTIREAFRLALEEKQGAVHIEFPEDVSAEEVYEDTKGVFTVSSALIPSVNLQSIEQATQLVKKAKLPLLLVGSSANRNNASIALTNFVNKTGIPFFTTQMGKGVIDDNNKHFIGTASLSGNDYLHTLIAKADLIINVGYDPIEKPPYFLGKNSITKVIHINNTSGMIDEIYNPELEVLGDISSAVNALTNSLGELNQDFSYAFKVKEFLQKQINSFADNNSFPIKPQKLVLDIDKVVGENGYIALDNGMYKLWFARNFTVHKPYGMILDNALATMGAGLPSAMEIARLYPNERVLAIVGDGGFMMNSQEIETALRLKLNIVVVILNDNAYGMIEWKQAGMGFANYGMKFNNPDFVKYAESYGAKGYRLQKTEDFSSLLEKCFNEKGVCIIDVPIDYSENDKFFNKELNNKIEIK
jgi:acetolactate synthase-1/2/3 large subunit